MTYSPPFKLTDDMINLVAEISEQIGKMMVLEGEKLNIHLRRQNNIRSVHSSLKIEKNSLSLEQVTAIINGKRVFGNPNEIQEVKNAYTAYELMPELDPLKINDLLKAHKIMMKGLIPENGRFRSQGVGVFDGMTLIHMASPAHLVAEHIKNLISWYKRTDLNPLIKSAVFHYEFEFIHPFMDGNGRIGRMWHSLLLAKWKEIFYWLPVEELIQSRQAEYYDALASADKEADSTDFIVLMLEIIRDSLLDYTQTSLAARQDRGQVRDQDRDQDKDQDRGQEKEQESFADNTFSQNLDVPESVNKLLSVLGEESLSSKELMKRLKLSSRSNFRKNYLTPALTLNLIEMTIPEKPNSKNQKYRRSTKPPKKG